MEYAEAIALHTQGQQFRVDMAGREPRFIQTYSARMAALIACEQLPDDERSHFIQITAQDGWVRSFLGEDFGDQNYHVTHMATYTPTGRRF